jgi:hypothetical protein
MSDESPRGVSVTVYQLNIPDEVISLHSLVVRRSLPVECEYVAISGEGRAATLGDFLRELQYDVYLALDIDCVPTQVRAVSWMLANALAGMLIAAAQNANHIDNGGHLNAGPRAIAFSFSDSILRVDYRMCCGSFLRRFRRRQPVCSSNRVQQSLRALWRRRDLRRRLGPWAVLVVGHLVDPVEASIRQ